MLRVMAVLASNGAAVGASTTASELAPDDSLQAAIDDLRSEIARYRTDREDHRLDAERRDAIREVVADVLADAGTRTSFAEGDGPSFTAGWNKGFKLESADGDFSLRLSGEMQIWYVVNHREGDQVLPLENHPGVAWGMENRRTRLRFGGHVGDPSIQYRVQVNMTRVGGVSFLEFGLLKFVLAPEWSLSVGQFRPLFMREWNVPVWNQLAVDRSVVAAYFNPGFAQGAELEWRNDRFRMVGWFGDGLGSRGFGPARTNSSNTPWNETATRWSFTTRSEWKPLGTWAQFNDMTSPIGSETGLLFGVDCFGQAINDRIPAADGTVAFGLSADISLDLSGASVMASFTWGHTEPVSSPSRSPWGLTVQAAHYLTDEIELFARYSYLDYDSPIDLAPRTARYDGFTVGWNWYFNPQVKLTMDWGLNAASLGSGAFEATGIGYRVDEPGADHQWSLRTQLQLLF